MERIEVEELHARFKAQAVSAREHIAFKCVVCGTVQSMASLQAAGCDPAKLENYVGFSCEGRFTGAGPWPPANKTDAKSKARSEVRGCDWTLGGLLSFHNIEVIRAEGKPQPIFDIATADEAQALERMLAQHATAGVTA